MRWGVLGFLALSLATAVPGFADDNRVQAAEAAMQRGITAAERSEHETALAAFEEAARLVPDANLPHRLAGEALEALSRWSDAIAAYKRYISIKPDAKGVPEVTARIERIEREHLTTLEVKCTPPGAVIALDGKAIGITPLAPITLAAPATLSIAVSSPGLVSRTGKVELVPGTPSTFECALIPPVVITPTVTVVSTRPLPKPEPERAWYRRWSVMGPVIGVAAIAIGAGIVLSLSSGVPNSDGGSHPVP